MRRAVFATGLLLLAVCDDASAQSAPAFEVASIKKAVSSDVPTGIRPIGPGGQFHAVMTVHDLVRVAYGAPLALLDSQVVGGPPWAKADRFEISAKIAGRPTDFSSGPPAHLLNMIRTLLADRFRLRTRREIRRLPVYDLVLDKSGTSRLRPADGTCASTPSSQSDARSLCGFTRVVPGQISARGMTLDILAGGLVPLAEVERVVRNRLACQENSISTSSTHPGSGRRAIQRPIPIRPYSPR